MALKEATSSSCRGRISVSFRRNACSSRKPQPPLGKNIVRLIAECKDRGGRLLRCRRTRGGAHIPVPTILLVGYRLETDPHLQQAQHAGYQFSRRKALFLSHDVLSGQPTPCHPPSLREETEKARGRTGGVNELDQCRPPDVTTAHVVYENAKSRILTVLEIHLHRGHYRPLRWLHICAKRLRPLGSHTPRRNSSGSVPSQDAILIR